MGFSNRSQQNLKEFPAAVAQHLPGTRVVSGDMHGNVIKYLHFLITEGVVDMPKEDYLAAARLYYETPTTRILDVRKFQGYLDKISIKNPNLKVMSIGDELYDRGKNDALSLLLFKKIGDLGIDHTFIASNHSMEFLKCFSNGLSTPFKARYHDDQVSSMKGLQDSISKTAVQEADLNNIVENNFLKSLKLLTYDDRNSDKEIIIYSHVPITQEKIKIICQLLQVPYAANSVTELKTTIDAINQSFSMHIKDQASIKQFFSKLQTNQDKSLDRFVHDRYADAVTQNANDTQKYPYTFINVHGHVSEKNSYDKTEDRKTANVIYCNIDTNIGKGAQGFDGTYCSWSTPNQYQDKLSLDKNYNKLLHQAVTNNSIDMVRKSLLDKGTNINYLPNGKLSPLFVAINNDNKEITNELLNHHPALRVSYQNKDMDCVSFAILNNKTQALDAMMQHPTLPAHFQKNWQSHMMTAINIGNVSIAEQFLKHYYHPNATLLTWAINEMQHALIPALLQLPTINLNAPGKDQLTPLELAIKLASEQQNTTILSQLIAQKKIEVPNNLTESIITAFHHGIKSNQGLLDMSEELRKFIVQPSLNDNNTLRISVIQHITANCHDYISSNGADPDREKKCVEKLCHDLTKLIENERTKMTSSTPALTDDAHKKLAADLTQLSGIVENASKINTASIRL